MVVQLPEDLVGAGFQPLQAEVLVQAFTATNAVYGRPASDFGIVPQAHAIAHASLIDQLTEIQAAIDWSAANLAPVYFPAGDFGFDGTLYQKTGMAIAGVPGGDIHTVFRQINQLWPDCLIPLDPVNGAINVTITDLAIDGGWTKTATYGTGNNWSFATVRTITGVTKANPGVVSIPTNQEYVNGQRIQITGIVGMTELNGNDYLVANATGTTITLTTLAGVAVNTSSFGAYVSGGTTSSMLQRGLYLNSPDTGADTHNYVFNVRAQSIAGIGIQTNGRGEMVLQKLWTNTTAVGGMLNGSFDNWVDIGTFAVSGAWGYRQAAGNSRLSNIKSWFVGYNELASEVYGVANEITGSSTRNNVGVNITAQDTWGPGFKSAGEGNYIQGGADCVGSLFQHFGIGNSTVISEPFLELNGARYDEYHLTIASRFVLPTLAYLVNVLASNTTGNDVLLGIDEVNTIYNTTTPVVVAAGNATAKRRNFVRSAAGLLFLGSVTAAQMADAADGINSRPMKGKGTLRIDSTNNRQMMATGPLTTDPWVGPPIVLNASATYDAPSLADGAGTTTTVTTTGALLGDFAMASLGVDLQGISVTAYVNAADTVSVRLQNESGGVVDLASTTLAARVVRLGSDTVMPA